MKFNPRGNFVAHVFLPLLSEEDMSEVGLIKQHTQGPQPLLGEIEPGYLDSKAQIVSATSHCLLSE